MCASSVTWVTVLTFARGPIVSCGGDTVDAAMSRRRVDTLLAERGLAESRTSAAASVRAGLVRLEPGGRRAEKPSQLVPEDAELVVDEGRRFASRGGLKLERALDELDIDVAGLDCLDVGASTGGFTDCLLQRGAARVIALDVGYGQLEWRLRHDPRVEVIERTNARHLAPSELPWAPRLATIDVSFISLAKVLGPVTDCLAPGGEMLALVKPQFELERGQVGKGGVVRDPADRRAALVAVGDAARELRLAVLGFAPSGLPGPKGNRETFVHLSRDGHGIDDLERAAAEVES
jgi:23S rRNA (cytidine1920-2'-O)/16S rRNA (cytidine1409-2'-O)-methyltransferase